MRHSPSRAAAALAGLWASTITAWSTQGWGQGFQLSAIPGASVSYLNYPDSASGAKPRVGAVLHLAAEVPLTPVVALRAGGALVERGNAGEGDQVRLRYLEAPVQVRFQGAERDRTVPWVALGVAAAFPVSCRAWTMVYLPGGTFGGYWRQPIACAGAYDAVDVGLTGSVGLRGPPAPLTWIAELRYTHGATNLADAQRQRVRNRSVTFGIGASWLPRWSTRPPN